LPTVKQALSHLILGQKGGHNRIQIIDLLKERPYNLNQMAEILDLNYRTVKHHVEQLKKNELVSTSKTGGYGEVYFLTPQMEGNIEIFNDIVKKFTISRKLTDFQSSPKFFKNVMEQTHDAVIIINNEGQVFFWNASAEKLYGFPEKEIWGHTLQIFPDEKLQEDLIKKVSDGEQIVAFETKLKHKSGKEIYVTLTMDAIKDENSNIIGYSLLSRDITDHKKAEVALERSEERYALAQRAANIGSWDWNIETSELVWSDTIEPLFGFKKGEFGATYEDFLECVHPDDRQYVIDSVDSCVEHGGDYSIEHRIVWPDGTIRWVSENGNVIRNDDGKAVRMLGIVQDITEQKLITEKQNLTIDILEQLNRVQEGPMTISGILEQIKEYTGFEAVGIRLKKDNDYPYFVTKGFPGEFVEAEKYLCAREDNGKFVTDSNEQPVLECMCGNVISGRTDPTLSFFTEGGSFFTNSTTELLASATEEELQSPTRNRCNGEGYESVALIPLHSGQDIVGLLQMNDSRPNLFSLSMIRFFEKIGNSIGIAFSKMVEEKGLKQNEFKYHR
jgi:PAS domain S-box-containing protein